MFTGLVSSSCKIHCNAFSQDATTLFISVFGIFVQLLFVRLLSLMYISVNKQSVFTCYVWCIPSFHLIYRGLCLLHEKVMGGFYWSLLDQRGVREESDFLCAVSIF